MLSFILFLFRQTWRAYLGITLAVASVFVLMLPECACASLVLGCGFLLNPEEPPVLLPIFSCSQLIWWKLAVYFSRKGCFILSLLQTVLVMPVTQNEICRNIGSHADIYWKCTECCTDRKKTLLVMFSASSTQAESIEDIFSFPTFPDPSFNGKVRSGICS